MILANTLIMSAAEAGLSSPEISAFYAAHWARPIALMRQDFCDWQFSAAPAAHGMNHSVVAIAGDEVVAVLGVVPAPFSFASKICAGAELTTWIVAPSARGHGVGKAILAYLQDRYEVLTGAGITAAALPLYLGAGFTFLAHIPRFFHIADFTKASVFAAVSDPARRIQAGRQSRAAQTRWTAEKVAAGDLAPSAAFGEFSCFLRDSDRLTWRHDLHPAFEYEAFVVHAALDDSPGAGVILREDLVGTTPILHVIDLFGAPMQLPAALAFIEAEAGRRGAAFVDISLTAGPLIAQVRARGWSSAIDDTLIEMPSLFHPVELRRPATTSMVLWGRQKPERLYNFSALHITRADMDLDRPTLHWYEHSKLKRHHLLS